MTPELTAPPDTPPALDPRAARGAMLTVFLVVFIDLLGFGIVLPVMPVYAKRYIAPGEFSPLVMGALIGTLYASFSVMQFLFGPVWGRLSDRVGRRPVLLFGLLGSVVFYTLFGVAAALPTEYWPWAVGLLLLARTGQGIAGATIATAQAVIADCTTFENRAKGMGLIGAAFGMGFTFGPLIAAGSLLLARWVRPGSETLGVEGYVAAGLSLVALLIALGRMPETLRPHRAEVHRGGVFDLAGTAGVLRLPVVGVLVLTFAMVVFAFANFEGTLSLLVSEAFGIKDEGLFVTFAFIGLVLTVAQMGVYRRLVGRFGEVAFLRAGVALMFVGLALVGLTAWLSVGHDPDTWRARLVLLYGSLTVLTTGFALVNPSVSSLLSKAADPARQGEVLGVNQSMSALSRIAGPFLGTSVFYLTESHALPYVQAIAFLGLALFALPWVRKPAAAPAA